jgi:methylmalonyl-CoA mutase N-terminal domain/subunit
VLNAIEKGYVQKEIADSSYRYQLAVESGDQVVVGLNKFETGDAGVPETLEVGEEIEQKQIGRLGRLKSERDQSKVDSALKKVEQAAQSSENLMSTLVDAAAEYATVGEMTDVLRSVFGPYRERTVV